MSRLAAALVFATLAVAAHAQDVARPLYWQDPDGKPSYASGPRKTGDGREYRAVFEDAQAPQAAPAATGGEHRVLYYRNPMGLPDTSPVPKKDSMGMDYTPVYADEGAGDAPGAVRIAPGRLQTLGVRTEAVTLRPATGRRIHATGTVQYDERRLATVTTKVAGWVERLDVSATGDSVRRGQALAQIYSPDLVASEGEYLVAAGMGGPVASAALDRLRSFDVPADEIARLRRTGRPSRLVAVAAASAGIVVDKPVQQGMRVAPGDTLYRTADLSSVWLIAQVQERDLGAVSPGQRAQASFVAFPGRSFAGVVELVYPSLSAETRTARVRIVVPNPDGALRAAMFADVTLDGAATAGPVLAVPDSAVLDNGTRQVVLIDRGGGRFEPRTVTLGVRGEDWVEVRDGLATGDRVVVGANFLIDAESNLRAALQGFTQGAKP